MNFNKIAIFFSSRERLVVMLSKLKSIPCTSYGDYEEKMNRFRSVDTDTLLSLYSDIKRTRGEILKALDNATATQAFYFSADAGNCAKTLSEIQNVLFARGVRDFST